MSAGRAVRVVLTVLGLAVVQLWRLSRAAGFPPDIANRHYEFLYEGDVNLGAVVSVHTSVRGRCIEDTTMGKSVSVSVSTRGKSVSVRVHTSVRRRRIEDTTMSKSVSVSVNTMGKSVSVSNTGKV